MAINHKQLQKKRGMDLTDTVLIALITGATGFVGAFFGYLTARMSSREQRKRDSEAAIFRSRLSAYSAFLEALANWAIMKDDEKARSYLFRKTSEAALVASDHTWKCLDKIQAFVLLHSNSATKEEHQQFLLDKSELISAMRDDLSYHHD